MSEVREITVNLPRDVPPGDFPCRVFCHAVLVDGVRPAHMDNEVGALVLGSSLLLAAVGVDRTPHSVITPSWCFFGAIGSFYGLF
jgi:hypothetical protein